MVTMTEWYKRANDAWPSDLPTPTDAQAINAVKRLRRWALGKPTNIKRFELVSGRRYTWPRNGVWYVNPNRREWNGTERIYGWRSLIHDLSHYCYQHANPGARPHSKDQAQLELRMVKQVIARGWLTPEVKPADLPQPAPASPAAIPEPAPVVNVKAVKLARIEARMGRWQAKMKRAHKALSKLNRQRAYYVRALAQQDARG